MKTKITAIFLSVMLVLSGCNTIKNASNLAKGGVIGGVAGGGLGAGIGALIGKGKGAAIGAAIGAVVGAGTGLLIGNKMDKAKKAAQAAGAEAEVTKDENGISYVKVNFPAGILFASGKSDLTADAQTSLATFAAGLESDMDLYINGYTDNVGFRGKTAEQSKELNKELSVKRASSVSSFLMTKGVKGSQFKEVTGYGEENPVGDNSTAAGREQNRRVEIFIAPSQDMINAAKKESGEA